MTTIKSEQKFHKVTGQVVFQDIIDALELVSTQTMGLIKILSHDFVTKLHVCMTGKQIVAVYQLFLFRVNVPKFSNAGYYSPKAQTAAVTANVVVIVVHTTNEHNLYLVGVAETVSDSSLNSVHYDPAPRQSGQMAEHESLNQNSR